MIHEENCTYEVAKLAKEKGFDLGCLCHYDCEGSLHQNYIYDYMNSGVSVDDHLLCNGHLDTSECLAPTQSLLQRWLREEKALHIQITLWEKGWYYDIWAFECYEEGKEYSAKMLHQSPDFSTYELALEDAELYVLKNLV